MQCGAVRAQCSGRLCSGDQRNWKTATRADGSAGHGHRDGVLISRDGKTLSSLSSSMLGFF